jgi:hypothetical protein
MRPHVTGIALALALGAAGALTPLLAIPRAAAALPVGDLWVSEVMYNPTGFGDDGREWVELYNAGAVSIDLSSYSLGWGGPDYTTGVLQLAGTILPGQYFVVGGPGSDAGNGNPTYQQIANFTPDLVNPFFVSAGIALFDVDAASVTPATVPVHAFIYGGLFGNLNGLMDESGAPGAVDVPFPLPGGGASIEFDGASWAPQGAPTPGTGNLVPEPRSTLLLALGLLGLAVQGRKPRSR